MAKPKREGWILVVCIAVLLGLIFFEPSYGWKIRMWLTPQATLQGDNSSLATENQTLAAQLAELQSVQAQLPQAPANYIRAMVYSRYPLNFKSEFLVNAGTAQGVAQGSAVVFQGIAIGSVEKVYANSSLVESIFDNDFKLPVRIGSGGYDGLLTGGADPIITSIQKGAPLMAGDIVYSAGSGFPYALPVGTVVGTTTSPDALFEQASLSFGYDLNTIQTVLIAPAATSTAPATLTQ
ncbi:MAG TPA: rod shape-determining protein MreC [Candidatus Paceibacterota bacterium]|nr:rod shape-determining protein MreC [Candidatus Paceibacterota bacterium]